MVSSRLITPNLCPLEHGSIKLAQGSWKEGVHGGEAALAGVIHLIKRKWEREFQKCLNFVPYVLIEPSGEANAG